MYVAAKCFPKARITGIDLFKRGSISEISIQKAADNMRSLGIESRTSFLTREAATSPGSKPKPMEPVRDYDLAISNLVFHNLGKKRFEAYGTVFGALKRRGYFVLGDLFPYGKSDTDYFRERSTLITESEESGSGPWAYKTMVLRKT